MMRAPCRTSTGGLALRGKALAMLCLCTPLFCAPLSAAPVAPDSAADFTPGAALQAMFEVEGESPYPSPYTGTLIFSALQSKYDSGHGHGYRNELKVMPRHRLGAAATDERFSAVVTATLPAGAKTIVAQYHAEGLDTLLKVYVQDTADSKAIDGKAGNGLFDVLVRIKGPDGKEAMTPLGTVRSGESFGLEISLAAGEARVSASTAQHGAMRTAPVRIKNTGENIYFKFGDYLQALDPATQAHTTSREKWDQYYQQNRIGSSQVRFSNAIFQRGRSQP